MIQSTHRLHTHSAGESETHTHANGMCMQSEGRKSFFFASAFHSPRPESLAQTLGSRVDTLVWRMHQQSVQKQQAVGGTDGEGNEKHITSDAKAESTEFCLQQQQLDPTNCCVTKHTLKQKAKTTAEGNNFSLSSSRALVTQRDRPASRENIGGERVGCGRRTRIFCPSVTRERETDESLDQDVGGEGENSWTKESPISREGKTRANESEWRLPRRRRQSKGKRRCCCPSPDPS